MRTWLLPKLLAFAVKFLNRTVRFKFVNRSLLDFARQQNKPLIYAFWEGREFLLFGGNKENGLAVMASSSRDGALIRSVLKLLKFYPIAGSSSRKAVSGLKRMIEAMKEGHNACFIVDGPRGPIYQVKPGVIYLASKTASIIIPVTTKAKYCYIFKRSWCKYEVPLPFSPAVIIFGQPLQISKDADREIIEQKRLELEDTLQDITRQADIYYN